MHPTHWLISTQVAASKQWLSYSMRAWLPGGKQAPEPTPEESKSLSHFRVGNVLEPIEPLTGIARHPFARVGCGGGVDLCGNQIYGAFASTSTPSTRRLLDGVAVPLRHRSTEPARPRHRREMSTRHTG